MAELPVDRFAAVANAAKFADFRRDVAELETRCPDVAVDLVTERGFVRVRGAKRDFAEAEVALGAMLRFYELARE